MINLKTIPFRYEGAKKIEWADPVLILDGVDYDLSLLPDGDTAKTENQLRSVTRSGDDYSVDVAVAFYVTNKIRTTIDQMEFTASEDGVILMVEQDIKEAVVMPEPLVAEQPEPSPEPTIEPEITL